MSWMPYVKTQWFDPTSQGSSAIVDGRLRLRMVIALNRGDLDGDDSTPVSLRAGSASGAELYAFDMNSNNWNGAVATIFLSNVIINLGGNGILFDDGIYYNGDSDVCSNSVTLVYS